MIQCPVCSTAVDSEAQLVRCEGCIWDDPLGACRARRRLDGFRKGAGEHAYRPDGCAVCASCRAHFQPQALVCPLVLLYNAPAGSLALDPDGEPERFLAEVDDCWMGYLADRNYPEHVEAYWRRLTQSLKEPTGP